MLRRRSTPRFIVKWTCRVWLWRISEDQDHGHHGEDDEVDQVAPGPDAP